MTSRRLQKPIRIGFRCDGGTQLGLGHIVGSLRLAQLVDRSFGVEAEFQVRACPTSQALVRDAGYRLHIVPACSSREDDIEQLLSTARQRGWSAIVINFCKADLESYAHLFSAIKMAELALIFMDNPIPPGCWHADVLLNALPHPPYLGYTPSRDEGCLDGLEYFLLDEAHHCLRNRRSEPPRRVQRVLVAMGGGDADNTTAKVIEALLSANFAGTLDIVLGIANPHRSAVEALFARSGLNGEIGVQRVDLAERIIAADLGFSALGLTTYEMAALGLPALLIPSTPLNTEVAFEYSNNYGAAQFLGCSNLLSVREIAAAFLQVDIDRQKRMEMSANGKQIGSRVDKVLAALSRVIN